MNATDAVYDTKPYDRESLASVEGAEAIDWRFLDFRLSPDSAHAASGRRASKFGTLLCRRQRKYTPVGMICVTCPVTGELCT